MVEAQEMENEKLLKRIEDLEYGKEAFEAEIATSVISARNDFEKYTTLLFGMIANANWSKEKIRRFTRELKKVRNENRKMNEMPYDSEYVEDTEEKEKKEQSMIMQ